MSLTDETQSKAAGTLVRGESVDLEGDLYADPYNADMLLQDSYATVVDVVEEEVDGFQVATVTFALDGSEMVVAFPAQHKVPTVEID